MLVLSGWALPLSFGLLYLVYLSMAKAFLLTALFVAIQLGFIRLLWLSVGR